MTASARLHELKKRYNENPRRFFAPLANEFRKTGDLDLAIGLCEEHLAVQPSNMNGHVVYGQALFEAGRVADAQVTFGNAIALDPENLIALRHLGIIAQQNGEVEEARGWFARILDADPRNDEIIGFLAALGAADSAERSTKSLPFISMEEDAAPTAPTFDDGDAHEMPEPSAESSAESSAEPDLGAAAVSVKPFVKALELPDFGETPEPDVAFHDASDVAFDVADEAVDLPVASPTFAEFLDGQFQDPLDEPAEDRGSPFVTATMADLYLQQGHTERALEVFQQLLLQRPDDEALKLRIRALMPTPVLPTSGPTSGPTSVPTARAFFAAFAARQAGASVAATMPHATRTLDAFFGNTPPATTDEQAANVLSTYMQPFRES